MVPQPFRDHKRQNFADAALATLYSNEVPPGQIWHIERWAYEGDKITSGGNTRARMYVDGHGAKMYVDEQDAPAADTLYKGVDPLTLWPGERLALEWDQAQAATILQMYLHGVARLEEEAF